MAFSLVRTNITRHCNHLFGEVVAGSTKNAVGSFRGVPLAGRLPHQVAFISCKRVRDELQVKKSPPFPYWSKKYNIWQYLTDYTLHRFDENTKVIVVDGNVAAGKSSFAQKLAEELDMYYVREPNMDEKYINQYGFDLRELDPLLPESAKSFDLQKFLKNPHHENAAAFQVNMLVLRFIFYFDSLCHLMNTGQGIVMDRSVFSDIVFLETMFKFGYVSKNARKVYHTLRDNTLIELLKPHLVVYLDVPAKTCLERIKRRALPHEIETNVLSLEYLQCLEDQYKSNYLQTMSQNSEILVYDWSEYGDVEVVIEDIERLDFDNYDIHESKCKDWKVKEEFDWSDLRDKFTNNKLRTMNYFNIFDSSAPELILSGADNAVYQEALAKVPSMAFEKGFNPEMDEKWVIFKTKGKVRDTVI